ncbi:MAG: GrpB family protein [Gaiellaceae bacterium]
MAPHPDIPPPLTDEEIRAAAVGDLPEYNAKIELAEYDPEWPRLYEREAERIGRVLGPRMLRIEHVGSTSVPGLAAKPLIDIVLVVADTTDEDAYVPPLDAAGYVLRIREPDWFEHRLFKRPDTNVNVHTFSEGCEEVDRMVGFRDWLRTHDDDRDLYLAAKRELAQREWKYVQNYADAKSAVVREILARTLGE